MKEQYLVRIDIENPEEVFEKIKKAADHIEAAKMALIGAYPTLIATNKAEEKNSVPADTDTPF